MTTYILPWPGLFPAYRKLSWQCPCPCHFSHLPCLFLAKETLSRQTCHRVTRRSCEALWLSFKAKMSWNFFFQSSLIRPSNPIMFCSRQGNLISCQTCHRVTHRSCEALWLRFKAKISWNFFFQSRLIRPSNPIMFYSRQGNFISRQTCHWVTRRSCEALWLMF